MQSILYNLARLVSFRGRESRRLFWPYAIVIIIIAIIGLATILLPAMAESFDRMVQYSYAHRWDTVQQVQDSYTYHGTTIANESLVFEMDLEFITVCVLLAAAVARRLHDRDLSGFWGFLPLPFFAYVSFNIQKLLAQNPPDMFLFIITIIEGMVSFLVLVALLTVLAGETKP